MSTLVVLKFDSVEGARQMRERLLTLQKQQLLQVDDAAIMSKDANGKPKLEQLHNLAGAGALGGAFWGMLFGLLFFIPILGLAVGAAAGALAGSMSDVGIDDKFIKQVGESITPGTAALFLLVSNVTVDKVLDQIKDIKFEVLQTNLSNEQENQLRSALGQSAPEASDGAPTGGEATAPAPTSDATAAPTSDAPTGEPPTQ
jgi:uncharacterized membrane protein